MDVYGYPGYPYIKFGIQAYWRLFFRNARIAVPPFMGCSNPTVDYSWLYIP